jgi:hypothetical protein
MNTQDRTDVGNTSVSIRDLPASVDLVNLSLQLATRSLSPLLGIALRARPLNGRSNSPARPTRPQAPPIPDTDTDSDAGPHRDRRAVTGTVMSGADRDRCACRERVMQRLPP